MKKKILLVSILLSIGALPTFANKYIYNENTMQIQEIEETTADKINKLSDIILQQENNHGENKYISNLYWCRGGFYKFEKNYTMALKDYNTSLKYNPNNINTLKALRDLKAQLKDYDGALIEATNIIKKEPKSSQNYTDRAYIYFLLGQYQNSINDYTQAIVIQPKNPDAFEMRGYIEILNKQKDKGFQDLDYAKKQYYELQMYDKYQHISKYIDELKNIQTKNYSKYPSSPNYAVNSLPSPVDYQVLEELKNLNSNLKSIDRTLLFENSNDTMFMHIIP